MDRLTPSGSDLTLWVSLVAVFTALTTVATAVLFVPIPATDGYFNFGDIMVMISGLLLGPIGGFVAGGVGSMLADAVLAPFYVPITLVVKGLEGMAVGFLSSRTKSIDEASQWDVAAVIVASAIMLLGYFLAEGLVFGFGPALIELLLFNFLQVAAGSIVTLLVGPKLRWYLASQSREVGVLPED
ncbi:ECF transporter S component [Candidatus Thorarchaeota archaeon]|nr:MAG: ECF transporter S component [Candidatus Thorarchaeota archaeon]